MLMIFVKVSIDKLLRFGILSSLYVVSGEFFDHVELLFFRLDKIILYQDESSSSLVLLFGRHRMEFALYLRCLRIVYRLAFLSLRNNHFLHLFLAIICGWNMLALIHSIPLRWVCSSHKVDLSDHTLDVVWCLTLLHKRCCFYSSDKRCHGAIFSTRRRLLW